MIGVLGAGQLGRMLALAGYPLGQRFRFLDAAHEAPVRDLAEFVRADFTDLAALDRFAAGLDVATYEFENVPVDAVEHLARRLPVYPPPAALRASQDRLEEKTFFRGLGIPTAPFVAVSARAELDSALDAVGYPAILKTRRMGYDGKGQCFIRERAAAEQAWQALQRAGSVSDGNTALADASGSLLEGYVRFDRELSQLAVRGRDGRMVFYPLVENHHADCMLRLSLAPAPNLTPGLEQLARDYATRVLEALNYVGVLAIEFFQQGERLLANEMAPRVHNSGHWTIEAAETSQFENHLRAILGLPLGAAGARETCGMLNIIGELPETRTILAHEKTHLHLYGKRPRPGRKIGHFTVRAGTIEEVLARIARMDDFRWTIEDLSINPQSSI
ncbi:MAG TPA: 5-(carboxyamino)imidazole ribonucleotide synthase [Gemmataceae bacterium]|nr:5-(carboxyamino)imidazole ribonucleotide synthase [Gemmataceae bacterium]